MSAALRRGGRHGLGFRVIRTGVCRSCRHRGQGAIFKPAGQASDVKRELGRALPRGQPQVAPLVPLALGARPLDEAASARDREQADDRVVAVQLDELEACRTRLGVELYQLRPHYLGAGTAHDGTRRAPIGHTRSIALVISGKFEGDAASWQDRGGG